MWRASATSWVQRGAGQYQGSVLSGWAGGGGVLRAKRVTFGPSPPPSPAPPYTPAHRPAPPGLAPRRHPRPDIRVPRFPARRQNHDAGDGSRWASAPTPGRASALPPRPASGPPAKSGPSPLAALGRTERAFQTGPCVSAKAGSPFTADLHLSPKWGCDPGAAKAVSNRPQWRAPKGSPSSLPGPQPHHGPVDAWSGAQGG